MFALTSIGLYYVDKDNNLKLFIDNLGNTITASLVRAAGGNTGNQHNGFYIISTTAPFLYYFNCNNMTILSIAGVSAMPLNKTDIASDGVSIFLRWLTATTPQNIYTWFYLATPNSFVGWQAVNAGTAATNYLDSLNDIFIFHVGDGYYRTARSIDLRANTFHILKTNTNISWTIDNSAFYNVVLSKSILEGRVDHFIYDIYIQISERQVPSNVSTIHLYNANVSRQISNAVPGDYSGLINVRESSAGLIILLGFNGLSNAVFLFRNNATQDLISLSWRFNYYIDYIECNNKFYALNSNGMIYQGNIDSLVTTAPTVVGNVIDAKAIIDVITKCLIGAVNYIFYLYAFDYNNIKYYLEIDTDDITRNVSDANNWWNQLTKNNINVDGFSLKENLFYKSLPLVRYYQTWKTITNVAVPVAYQTIDKTNYKFYGFKNVNTLLQNFGRANSGTIIYRIIDGVNIYYQAWIGVAQDGQVPLVELTPKYNWPEIMSAFSNRVFFGGIDKAINQIIASSLNGFEDFSEVERDNRNPNFFIPLASGENDGSLNLAVADEPQKWCAMLTKSLNNNQAIWLFSENGLYLLQADANGNYNIEKQNDEAISSIIEPFNLSSAVFYVNKYRNKVFLSDFDFSNQIIKVEDISSTAIDIFYDALESISTRKTPWPQIYAQLGTERFLAFTNQNKNEIRAWTQHESPGAFTTPRRHHRQ